MAVCSRFWPAPPRSRKSTAQSWPGRGLFGRFKHLGGGSGIPDRSWPCRRTEHPARKKQTLSYPFAHPRSKASASSSIAELFCAAVPFAPKPRTARRERAVLTSPSEPRGARAPCLTAKALVEISLYSLFHISLENVSAQAGTG